MSCHRPGLHDLLWLLFQAVSLSEKVAVNLPQCFGWGHHRVFVHSMQSQIPFSTNRSKAATVIDNRQKKLSWLFLSNLNSLSFCITWLQKWFIYVLGLYPCKCFYLILYIILVCSLIKIACEMNIIARFTLEFMSNFVKKAGIFWLLCSILSHRSIKFSTDVFGEQLEMSLSVAVTVPELWRTQKVNYRDTVCQPLQWNQ